MWKKGKILCIIALIFAWMMGITSFAASSTLVRVYLYDNYEEGVILEPTITLSSGEIEDITWSKDIEDWKPGKKVTVTVTVSGLEVTSGSYKSRCRVDGGSLVSAREDDGNLVLKIEYYPVVQLGIPEEAGWSSSRNMVAVWKKVEYATGYKVKLYRNNEHVRTIRTTSSSLDLSEYLKVDDTFYYEVCASAGDTEDKDYLKDGEYTMSENITLDAEQLGDTEGRWKNYRDGKQYMLEDGKYAVGWQLIMGDWYYFNEEGIMQTGWVSSNGKWYHMNSSGTMQTGTIVLDDGTYFLDGEGVMQTGWIQAGPTKWYYALADGKMAVNGWQRINEKWYYFNADGTMAFSTVIDGQYTLDSTGAMVE